MYPEVRDFRVYQHTCGFKLRGICPVPNTITRGCCDGQTTKLPQTYWAGHATSIMSNSKGMEGGIWGKPCVYVWQFARFSSYTTVYVCVCVCAVLIWYNKLDIRKPNQISVTWKKHHFDIATSQLVIVFLSGSRLCQSSVVLPVMVLCLASSSCWTRKRCWIEGDSLTTSFVMLCWSERLWPNLGARHWVSNHS